MAQNITLMGASYQAVPSVELPKTGGGTASFTDVTDTTAVASDVAQGKYFYTAAGVKTEGTATGSAVIAVEDVADAHGGTIRHITGVSLLGDTVTADTLLQGVTAHAQDGTALTGTYVAPTPKTASDVTVSGATVTIPAGAYASQVQKSVASGSVTAPASITGTSATVSTGTNTLTLSKTVSVTPSVTTAGYVSSGTAGNSSVSLTASVTTQAAQTIHPSTSDQTITGSKYLTGTQTIKAVTMTNLTADNIKSGVTVQIGDSTDSDCVTSVTGTYSGGGGTSKNVQVVQSTSRTTATSLTKVSAELTVSKTGTYDIYWSAGRTNTSSSYTWGTRLYIGSTAYGTENTAWTNNVQNNHLTNISLTVNDKLSVYARGRGGNYYAFVPMLLIIEQ